MYSHYNVCSNVYFTLQEYKVPEIVVDNEVCDSSVAFDDNPCLPIGNIIQPFSNNSSSSGNLSLLSDSASEDNYNASKENCSPVKTDILIRKQNDQVGEQSSLYYKKRIPENDIEEENVIHIKRRKTDFQNILQDYSNNSTLRDVIVSDAINENFYVTNVNYPEYDSKYMGENISGYPINLSSGNVVLTQNNIKYGPLCSINSTSIESHLQNVPSLPENLSDNCSSSTLTDNMHIDVENFSDSSNEICKIKTSSNNLNANNNVYDSQKIHVFDSPKEDVYDYEKAHAYDFPKSLVCDSPKAFVYDFPYGTLMNYDYALPYVSPSQSYLENYIEQNEILSRSVGYLPHFDTISPKNANYNESPSVIQYFEPIHSFQDRLVEPRFANDNASMYMPSNFESFPSERLFLLNSKSEIIKSEPDSHDDSEESKPGIFEEEVSYPLSQYINNF